jgi:hypothetical protein
MEKGNSISGRPEESTLDSLQDIPLSGVVKVSRSDSAAVKRTLVAVLKKRGDGDGGGENDDGNSSESASEPASDESADDGSNSDSDTRRLSTLMRRSLPWGYEFSDRKISLLLVTTRYGTEFVNERGQTQQLSPSPVQGGA